MANAAVKKIYCKLFMNIIDSPKHIPRLFSLPSLLSLFFLTGCASLGEGIGSGVANAVLEQAETEDTRVCQVWGQAFEGIDHALLQHKGKTKVLMTHGVGAHEPGYSTEFMEKLAAELGLSIRTSRSKDIALTSPEDLNKKLGYLRVTRYRDKEKTRTLLFYELTWSEITASEKALLAFDNSGEYSFRRADVNNLMKEFSNDTGPDPIIYLGKSRPDILTAFAQSFCWMAQGDWKDLPSSHGRLVCTTTDKGTKIAQKIRNDNFVFISHSLGSRITIDGMELIAADIGKQLTGKLDSKKHASIEVINALKEKEITLFMLSNQLPMLQLGRELPEISNQKAAYCTPGAPNYDKRMVKKTSLIAFSDPNDLLSYAIPPGFSDDYLDSRLCLDITNININIAFIMDAFGIGKMANPMEAHVGYDSDERVVALIAKGIGHPQSAQIVKDRCELVELED
jgi:hypothetical protein